MPPITLAIHCTMYSSERDVLFQWDRPREVRNSAQELVISERSMAGHKAMCPDSYWFACMGLSGETYLHWSCFDRNLK